MSPPRAPVGTCRPAARAFLSGVADRHGRLTCSVDALGHKAHDFTAPAPAVRQAALLVHPDSIAAIIAARKRGATLGVAEEPTMAIFSKDSDASLQMCYAVLVRRIPTELLRPSVPVTQGQRVYPANAVLAT